jgi:hypothetical protein
MATPDRPAVVVGSRVRLIGSPTYLKTADPMPMLRPPDLVGVGEEGLVVALKAQEALAVRFRSGTFLLDQRHVELLLDSP